MRNGVGDRHLASIVSSSLLIAPFAQGIMSLKAQKLPEKEKISSPSTNLKTVFIFQFPLGKPIRPLSAGGELWEECADTNLTECIWER